MPSIISTKCKFVSLHIPKTGGTSVVNVLMKLNNIGIETIKKIDMPGIKKCYPEIFKNYFKFCFVRNPWDRMVSGYFYLGFKDKNNNRNPIKYDFKEFVLKFYNKDLPNTRRFLKNPSFRSQLKWFTIKDKIAVDYIARFENIQKEFDYLCNKFKIKNVKLPHLKKTNHKQYRHYYDETTINLVRLIYKYDIELLNYDF